MIADARRAEQEEALSRLVGARLTSVQFILNYLIIGFDERGALTTLVWPATIDGDNVFRFGDGGYRDKICSLIEAVAMSITVAEDETVLINFHNSVRMQLPLGSYVGQGERAILSGPKHYLFVF